MKILQINTVCSYSSPARIMLNLYNILEENGHNCCIAYGRGDAVKTYNLIKIGTKFDIIIHGIISRVFDMHAKASKNATKNFIKNVEKYNPDIIHLHNIHGYYLNINLLFDMIEKLNKPVIWTLHDCWSFTGHCSYYDYVGCSKWKHECYECPQLKKYPSSYIFDNSSNNFTNKKMLYKKNLDITLVTPSNWLAGEVRRSILKNYKLQVINNGIDINIFKPSLNDYFECERKKGKKIILGVANVWDERKGFKRFIELANLKAKDLLFVMIGISKEQKEKLPKNVMGILRTDNINTLAQIYSSADIYLNLSVEETMGLTSIEALACGTQCIVLNATAIPEFVSRDCGEILSKNCTNEEIMNSIYELLQNPVSETICREWGEKYNEKLKYKEYIKLYNLIYNNKLKI